MNDTTRFIISSEKPLLPNSGGMTTHELFMRILYYIFVLVSWCVYWYTCIAVDKLNTILQMVILFSLCLHILSFQEKIKRALIGNE